MSFWNPFTWGKKRTAEEIEKARLLERANGSIDYAIAYLKENAGSQESPIPQFLSFMEDVQRHLNDTQDAAYIKQIDEIVVSLRKAGTLAIQFAAEGHSHEHRMDKIRNPALDIMTNLLKLQESIQTEIRRL